MTVAFRVEAVSLQTSNGPVTYSFRHDLTVLAGHTGVGKTALLELIKYGLGGDAKVAPVARQHVSDISVSIRIGDSRLQLSRGLDSERSKIVRVVDLLTRDRLADRAVGGRDATISDLLLEAMGMETGLRAASRGGRSTSVGTEITFNDIFRFMYVPQSEMNRDIAWSQDNYYNPKRKAVFELLFDITSASMLQMRSEVNSLKSQIDDANRDAVTVRQFLADTGLTDRNEALTGFEQAKQDEIDAKLELEAMRSDLAKVVDRESQVLRDLLNDAERSLAEATDLAVELGRQREEYDVERRRVSQDIDRLARMESAGMRLANIEFSVCPRCTQRLDQRQVPVGICRVCLQDDVVAGVSVDDQYESEQLQAQLGEIQEQLQIIEQEIVETSTIAENRRGLVKSLTAQIDERTASRVTPRLQAYADAAAKVERAAAAQQSLEQVLRQWDRARDLETKAEELTARRSELQSALDTLEASLAERKSELFAELDAEFETTVIDFRIPSVETASISPETYLPMLNGQPFTDASAAGGIITTTQVAYWISLVTVAARRRDTRYPAFLLLDSPRLALNAEDDIAGQMYRRFATQVDALPGRFQFIIADNELPAGFGDRLTSLEFSYESPTVSTIVHPGPAGIAPTDEWTL
ncbi:AAA family ATPase [Mycolicibacterium sp. 3033]|nr:AAA family ATPase [Mycolicibacterium aurantiacum]